MSDAKLPTETTIPSLDPFVLDPVDPPDGASDEERRLCAGLCPICEQPAAFAPVPGDDDDLVTCKACGAEFAGIKDDRPGEPPRRSLRAVYSLGYTAGGNKRREKAGIVLSDKPSPTMST
jgi:hypothetical protein